jgi:hypothetical protein
MAHQRQFLLEHSSTPYVLYLDDDIILESFVLSLMLKTIKKEQCGFVGSALIGLSFLDDVRPSQQQIEFCDTSVKPEKITPATQEWERYKLHNAANIYHVQQKLGIDIQNPKIYKVAWVGGCTLFDRKKLESTGGFSFWKDIPQNHCGEDVLAQQRVMKQYGGCGVLPSGAYHLELETTLPDRSFNAPERISINKN